MPPRPRQGKRPADMTGRLMQQQQKDHQAELELKSKEMAMAQEVQAQEKNELVDYTEEQTPRFAEVAPKVEVKDQTVVIRVVDKIEQMTFGREFYPGDEENNIPPQLGNLKMYDFEPGTPYRVPKELADHLDALGYVWH